MTTRTVKAKRPVSALIKVTREEFEDALIFSSITKQKKDAELREAADLALRTIGDTLRQVTMKDGERKALEKVSQILRRALRD